MMKNYEYVKVALADIPRCVRFSVPLIRDGSLVHVDYGGPGEGKYEDGAPYRRVSYRSQGGTETYYIRKEA